MLSVIDFFTFYSRVRTAIASSSLCVAQLRIDFGGEMATGFLAPGRRSDDEPNGPQANSRAGPRRVDSGTKCFTVL